MKEIILVGYSNTELCSHSTRYVAYTRSVYSQNIFIEQACITVTSCVDLNSSTATH